MPQQPLNVVGLSGSFAGLSVAHHFLDHIIHQLSNFKGTPTYRVVLVSPSTHFYWNICATLVSPGIVHDEKAFIPIEPAFSRYLFTEFTFTQGWAISVDTSARKARIELVNDESSYRHPAPASPKAPSLTIPRDADHRSNATARESKTETISYHALIIATSSTAYSPLFSRHGAHEQTLAELHTFHQRLEHARSVLIVGGNPSGVATAG